MGPEWPEQDTRCSTLRRNPSSGGTRPSPSRRARSPARPTARSSPRWARPRVMANVTFAKKAKAGQDFFPLTVHYQEKYYAAGKVPGGFFKREARPTEKETLTARLIDRPIRPLFVSGFKNEVLVMCTVLSHDLVNDPDIVAMIAAVGRADDFGRAVHGPDRGLPRRLCRWRVRAEPRCRGHAGSAHQPRAAARPDRRRHQGRGDDGRIGGLRALRGRDAGRGEVRVTSRSSR